MIKYSSVSIELIGNYAPGAVLRKRFHFLKDLVAAVAAVAAAVVAVAAVAA
jgi:hypothetical protein